jgi:hypothetical protein
MDCARTPVNISGPPTIDRRGRVPGRSALAVRWRFPTVVFSGHADMASPAREQVLDPLPLVDEAEWVADIRVLAELGVSAVDVRLFGYGTDQSLNATIGNMHRFRDGVLSKL